jgi:heterotetrameric sarcosine oxidase delta subunit
MMRLPCPWCGECDEIEFVYGGPSAPARPALECSDDIWGRYLYFRANLKGHSVERWRHAYGCGQWFNLLRDSLTHRVSAALKFGEAAP